MTLFDSRMTSTNPAPLLHQGYGGEDPIAEARDAFIKGRSKKQSPSGSSHPSSFRKTQREKDTHIPCGRPREPEEIIPVTLFHPVFGQFVDDCQTGTMTEDDNQFVDKLANAMSDVYEKETQRVEVVQKVFKEVHLEFNTNAIVAGTQYVMDTKLTLDDLPLPPYVIAEFKNEAAAPASEPFMQAVAYYLEATKIYAPRMSGLLYVFGIDKRNTFLQDHTSCVFAGAVWNLRPVVQVLSTPLAFHYHSTDTHNQLTVARHMAAFRKAVRTLKESYEGLPVDAYGLVNTSSHNTLFPYRTEFKSLSDESTKKFCYTEQLEEGGKKRGLIFFGTLTEDPTVQICIKFTRCYSKEAHLHCAELGFAPELRGFLPGGWYMVVMDRLVGYDLLADLPDTDHLPRSVFEAIGTQLKTLHARQLVHGDIRDTNILVKNDDRTKFMIFDFDWGGVENVIRYPPYVIYTDIQRPNDARDGLLIKAAHGLAMLDVITDMRAAKNL
ncbi:hypothetical protein JVT61DRAFT_4223 [Boletus reticuloceps]|uniref:Uncharacterized protein n=1 Tax=Boletus reticuloceps TaxID=495285 RepID=A0A8I3A987_9AGAM|nr:hypothetical protein JVT61DRAFT_4223 [Boletus reticuloceps]